MFKSLLRKWRPLSRIVIETERFTLRAVRREWLSRHSLHWSNDNEILEGFGWPAGPYKPRQWRRRFARSDNRKNFNFAIFLRGTDTLIGAHGVYFTDPGAAMLYVGIGDRDWWGKGAVQEVRTALLDYLFDRAGGHRAYGMVQASNIASIYNYQRLGFRHEGTMRRHRFVPITGEHVDLLVFGMLKEEWQARRIGVKTAAFEGIR